MKSNIRSSKKNTRKSHAEKKRSQCQQIKLFCKQTHRFQAYKNYNVHCTRTSSFYFNTREFSMSENLQLPLREGETRVSATNIFLRTN